jgi:hypothetical protein
MPQSNTANGALELLKARYGDQASEALQSGQTNDVISALLSHRSVRSYLSKPLPEGTLETPEALNGRERIRDALAKFAIELR